MYSISKNFKLLKRYLTLYTKNKLEFKFESFSTVFGVLITIFNNFIFWIALKNVGVKFQNWDYNKILLLIGFNFLFISINSIFFGFRDLEYKIISGEFDMFMVRGQNPLKLVLLERMNFLYIFLNLIFFIVCLFISQNGFKFEIINVLLAVLVSIFASLNFSLLYGMFSLLAFYFGKIFYVRELFFSIKDSKNYPMDIFPKVIYNLFVYTIPITLISTVPTKIAFGENRAGKYILISIAGFILLCTIFKLFSKKALKHYVSTGN